MKPVHDSARAPFLRSPVLLNDSSGLGAWD
jgi:hypothetical protein